MQELIVQINNGVAVTTSAAMADGTGVQHKNVLEMVRSYIADLEEFGGVAFETQPFETAGGTQRREVAILNEHQATLLLTYMRNNDVVRQFKKALVRAFYDMAQHLLTSKKAPAPFNGNSERPEARGMAVLVAAGISQPRAAIASLQFIERSTGHSMREFYEALPNIDSDKAGTLNATDLAVQLGMTYATGRGDAKRANQLLAEAGLQVKSGDEWKLTERGQPYAEYRPVATGKSSKMQIQWMPNVLPILKSKQMDMR